jgi:hypothetical protein
MSVLSRKIPLVALVCGLGASSLSAQSLHRKDDFQWYVGGQAGVLIYKTPTQSRGGNLLVGAHTLIKARRTGLLLSVDEMVAKDQTSSFSSSASPGGTESVTFNDIRRYTATLMAFPVRSAMQPYLGVGVGLMHVVNPQPVTNSSADQQAVASSLGSTGFGTLVGGLQLHAGRLMLFGQYQITTGARTKSVTTGTGLTATTASGHLIEGMTHSFVGGLRLSLGSSRESLSGY